ncbi:MAG: xanthine dehydrogenase family protein molybdopterin-binding subunit [Alphaproteobacteria bacterium]|nr:xanthine dehydrogenase family protein molybdopterin-binding subunit [Alphaproteobacteria bacterium]
MNMQISRRGFLKSTAAAALVIGYDPRGVLAANPVSAMTVNPFVVIGADDTVTVIAKHFEMGQGTTTGLATLVAEELDADWAQIRVDWAPADQETYKNLIFQSQGTGGSTAIANSFEQYRKAGAAARAVLVEAAAQGWGVAPDAISVEAGTIKGPGGKTARFGELIEAAAKLTPPEAPVLKDPSEYRLIGRENLPRYDSPAKTDGSAMFAMDAKIDGMVYAVIARPPRFGGKFWGLKDAKARAVKGVLDIKQTPRGVVVYATSTWAAIKGREALSVEWEWSESENRSTDDIMAEHVAALATEGLVARNDGDAGEAIFKSAKTIEAQFTFPFLAHAPMEPENCVIAVKGDKATVWDGCQFPSITQPVVAGVLGIPPENVEIKTMYAGGSFGRRANPSADYNAEAAMAAKALGDGRPVKLVWTREDDVKGGYYRPMFAHRIQASLDAYGKPVAWHHRLAGKSIFIGTFLEEKLVKEGVDNSSVEGASTLPYDLPNLKVDVRNMETKVPVLWWRAVGHTHTAYSTEVMMDMLAEAADADPVAFRMELLKGHPRHAGVLKLAADKAGWGKPLPKGWGRGVAVHESFRSFVAQVVDVSTDADGAVKVERVVCAVDCGIAVNPDVIRAQMEGGIGYGLGAIMRNKITLTQGEVDQTNFWDYEPLRISDMPNVEVHIVPSAEPPTGVGEPGTPPIGPALANAIYAATGKRVTKLPMVDDGITFA